MPYISVIEATISMKIMRREKKIFKTIISVLFFIPMLKLIEIASRLPSLSITAEGIAKKKTNAKIMIS
ncbi:hypothetical protein IPdc08_01378 [archaeon]|nr:hypothetical protein IPdc08_01378 [archaeon]